MYLRYCMFYEFEKDWRKLGNGKEYFPKSVNIKFKVLGNASNGLFSFSCRILTLKILFIQNDWFQLTIKLFQWENHKLTTWEMAQQIITSHLYEFYKVSKLGQWVPHDLTGFFKFITKSLRRNYQTISGKDYHQ